MKIYIMRGVPGSGKSTWANKMAAAHNRCTVFSADHYFHDSTTGEYKFEPAKLNAAHADCMRKYVEHLAAGTAASTQDVVVVDNTNIGLDEISPYVAVATAFGHEVEVVQFDVEPGVANKRNVHSVPLTKGLEMFNRMNQVRLPKRWKVTKVNDTSGAVYGEQNGN